MSRSGDHLVHVSLPGGRISADQLAALAGAAAEWGDGHLVHTGRAGLQLRGVAAEHRAVLSDRLAENGLAEHSVGADIRQVMVSPLSGRIGGTDELWAIADRLGASLRSAAWTLDLPDDFWFGLDDGRGDVLAHAPDIAGVRDGETTAELVVGGQRTGRVVDLAELAAALLDAARSDAPATDDADGDRTAPPSQTRPAPRVGWFDQDDGRVLLGAVTADGRLTARQAEFAAAIGAPLIITIDRELLIADLTEGVAETVVRVLAPQGFSFDANSPWIQHRN
ncbi:precorrin-3B synthase [Gordonia alkaliphila]|uniref:precorrin-3B synthase n=1 Tax=Gordonia alkaliphila TaxID=1053547 RepID=UPI001FF2DEBE|nr:precorrin-3B synthase [Gordonia alkaliphila]MCK0440711.1 precorrin-3B synthase [Gordonia alkaliphila]